MHELFPDSGFGELRSLESKEPAREFTNDSLSVRVSQAETISPCWSNMRFTRTEIMCTVKPTVGHVADPSICVRNQIKNVNWRLEEPEGVLILLRQSRQHATSWIVTSASWLLYHQCL